MQAKEENDDILSGGFVAVNFIDNIFNLNNYTYPANQIKQDLFTSFSNSYFKSFSIYIRNVDLITDIGAFLEEFDYKNFFSFDKTFELLTLNKQEKFLEITIRLSRLRNVYKRKYVKLADVLAQMGGLLKGIIIIFSVLFNFYQHTAMNLFLINKVFFFTDEVKTISYMKKNLDKFNKTNEEDKTTNNIQSEGKVITASKIKVIHQYNLKKKDITFKLLDFFKICLCPKHKLKKVRYDNYIRGKEKMNESLDVVFLIKRLHDIEMMTKIFLDKDQYKILKLNNLARGVGDKANDNIFTDVKDELLGSYFRVAKDRNIISRNLFKFMNPNIIEFLNHKYI